MKHASRQFQLPKISECNCNGNNSLNVNTANAPLFLFPELIECCIFFLQSVEGEHHEKAVELLKAAQGTVKLVVRYTPKVLEEMESRFEKMRSARRRQQNNYPQQNFLLIIVMPTSWVSAPQAFTSVLVFSIYLCPCWNPQKRRSQLQFPLAYASQIWILTSFVAFFYNRHHCCTRH